MLKYVDVSHQRPSGAQSRSMPVRKQYPDTRISLDRTSVSGVISVCRMLIAEDVLVPVRCSHSTNLGLNGSRIARKPSFVWISWRSIRKYKRLNICMCRWWSRAYILLLWPDVVMEETHVRSCNWSWMLAADRRRVFVFDRHRSCSLSPMGLQSC
jgi:hypothetical protein